MQPTVYAIQAELLLHNLYQDHAKLGLWNICCPLDLIHEN